MMSRHFHLSSELGGAIAKRPPHSKEPFWLAKAVIALAN